jgi:hypothetical protein
VKKGQRPYKGPMRSVDLRKQYPALMKTENEKEYQMTVTLKNVRLAFPDLFVAKAFEPGQEPKFGATFLIPKDDPQVKQIEAAIAEAAAAKWGAKSKGVLDGIRNNPNKFCFQDGDLKADYDGYEGHMTLSAKSKTRPLVIDRNKAPLDMSDGKVYGGCYVNASLELWAQDNQWGKGIRATLRGVQFFRDGDSFSGGRPASVEEFEDLGTGDLDSSVDGLI